MHDIDYTPVSTAAVASAVCAAIAAGGYLFPAFAIAGIPAIVFGLIAWREIRTYGLNGRRLVLVALPMSLTIAVGTAVLEGALYHAEAVEGHRHVNFVRDLDEFVGERICLKGYGHWQSSDDNRFALSPSGSFRDVEDSVVVELANGRRWKGYQDGVAVSGRLELLPPLEGVDDRPRYVLKDAVVRESRTAYGLAPRARGDC